MRFRDVAHLASIALVAIGAAHVSLGQPHSDSPVELPPVPAVHPNSVIPLDNNEEVPGANKMSVGTLCGQGRLSPSAAPSTRRAGTYPKTTKESAAGVTVIDITCAPGVVLRYGTNSVPGTTDMTAAIQVAINSNANVYLPAGVYRITAPLVLASNLTLYGDGDASAISAAPNIDIIKSVKKTNIILRDFAIRGAPSSVATDAIQLSGSSRIQVLRVEISGVSDQGVIATAGSSEIIVRDSFFHGWQNKVDDSADISFYNNVVDSKAIRNQCEGGGDHGIRFQLGSKRNVADSNKVGTHHRYGILAGYEVSSPAVANNVIINNQIENITGLGLISGQARAGAGIYSVQVGGLVIRNNTVKNTNINTAVETLTPAAIAMAAPYSASLIDGNRVNGCHWYGIGVFTNTHNAPVTVENNVVANCAKIGIYAKNFGNITIKGNDVENSRAAVDGIVVYGQGDRVSNVNIVDNRLRGGEGGMVNGIRLQNVNEFVVSGNHVQGPQGRGLHLIACDDGAIRHNAVQSAETSGIRFSNCRRVVATGGRYDSVGTYSVESSGVGIGNFLRYAEMRPFAASNADGSGLTIIGRHANRPTSGTWAAGDTVYYTDVRRDQEIGAVCIRSGSPGTWKALSSRAP